MENIDSAEFNQLLRESPDAPPKQPQTLQHAEKSAGCTIEKKKKHKDEKKPSGKKRSSHYVSDDDAGSSSSSSSSDSTPSERDGKRAKVNKEKKTIHGYSNDKSSSAHSKPRGLVAVPAKQQHNTRVPMAAVSWASELKARYDPVKELRKIERKLATGKIDPEAAKKLCDFVLQVASRMATNSRSMDSRR